MCCDINKFMLFRTHGSRLAHIQNLDGEKSFHKKIINNTDEKGHHHFVQLDFGSIEVIITTHQQQLHKSAVKEK